MRRTHLWAGALLALASAFCVFWLIPENTAPAESEIDLSPALVPSIAMGACLLLSLALLARAARAGREDAARMDEEFGAEASGVDGQVLANLALWGLVSAACWFGVEHVGFEPAMAAFLVATMLFVGARHLLTIAAMAVAAPIALSQLAYYLFSTELPAFWR